MSLTRNFPYLGSVDNIAGMCDKNVDETADTVYVDTVIFCTLR